MPYLMPWHLMIHWSMSDIIGVPPNSERYGDLFILLPGVSCTASMRQFVSLLASMMLFEGSIANSCSMI